MNETGKFSQLQMATQNVLFKIFKALMKPLHNYKKLKHHTPTVYKSLS